MIWIWGACTTVASVILATGYALGGFWFWSVAWIALGGLWWLGRRRWTWIGSVIFLAYVIAAVVGFWADLEGGWMLVGTVAALAAWDLDYFMQQLQDADRVEQKRTLVRAHLRQLALVGGGGLLLGFIALLIQVELSLGLTVLLGLLTVIGLRQFLAALRRESD